MSAVHIALRARAEAATGFPTAREHENIDFTTKPTDGSSYSEEDFVPATRTLTTNSPRGLIVATGLYVVRLYFPAKAGMEALSAAADAVLAQFGATWTATLSNGTTVRMRPSVLPHRGQIVNDLAGYARCTVTIPWQHWTYEP